MRIQYQYSNQKVRHLIVMEDENKVLGLDDVNATILQSLKEEEDEEKAEDNKEVACFSRQAKF